MALGAPGAAALACPRCVPEAPTGPRASTAAPAAAASPSPRPGTSPLQEEPVALGAAMEEALEGELPVALEGALVLEGEHPVALEGALALEAALALVEDLTSVVALVAVMASSLAMRR